MERKWRKGELENLSKPQLQDILRNRDQSTTGYKEKLIRRILEEVPLRLTVKPKRREEVTEERKFSLLADIPTDVLFETLFKLSYEDIVKICRTSTKFNRVCRDERFWQDYAKRHNIRKENPEETWKITVKYHNKMSRFSTPIKGKILKHLVWDLTTPPIDLNYEERVIGSTFVFIYLEQEEYDKILFRKTVSISIPKLVKSEKFEYEDDLYILEEYGNFRKGESVFLEFPDKTEPQHIIKIKPNTTYGSTLKHVLWSIYHGIWGLPLRENRDLHKLIGNIKSISFLLGFNYLELPSEGKDYHKLIARSNN
jgi:hypothetical protein